MARLTKHDAQRLIPNERSAKGSIRNYKDPSTGRIVSDYERRKSLNSGLSPKEKRIIRDERRVTELHKLTHRKKNRREYEVEHIGYLLDKYQEREYSETKKKRSRSAILRDDRFWSDLRNLRSRGDSPKGKKAKALESFGLRPRGSERRVGHSPRAQARK